MITKKAIESEVCIDKSIKLLSDLWMNYSDISLYILAFIHRSIVNERPDFAPEHNERLEFLWDAVLELVITNNLFKDYPEKTEWELTDIRSAIVRWSNLSKLAKKLNFSEYLYLWKWEDASWWRENDYLLANVVESFIWAVYLDQWLEAATLFIDTHIYPTIKWILKNNLTKDFKTLIQEFAQAKYDITPTYKVLSEDWPDHSKNFTVWVFLWDKKVGMWTWSSKKKAQESAARDGYDVMTRG